MLQNMGDTIVSHWHRSKANVEDFVDLTFLVDVYPLGAGLSVFHFDQIQLQIGHFTLFDQIESGRCNDS